MPLTWIGLLAFFLLGLSHGLTVFPLFAAGSALLVVLANVRPLHALRKLNHKAVLIVLVIVFYLCLNEVLHAHAEHLWDLRFYRAQGKVLYMLFLFAALYVLPLERLRKGVPAACVGFATGALIVQFATYFVGYNSPLIGGIAIKVVGGHNAISALVAQVVIVTFVLARMSQKPWRKTALAGLCLLSFAFFVLGFSRANTLGLVAALTIAALLIASRRQTAEGYFFREIAPYMLGVALIIVTAVTYQPERWMDLSSDRNVESRLVFWQKALDYVGDGMLFGTGLGGFAWQGAVMGSSGAPLLIDMAAGGKGSWESSADLQSAGIGHTHNLYLQVLTESGLIGFVLWIWFFAFNVKRALRLWRAPLAADAAFQRPFALILLSLIAFGLLAGIANGFTLMSPSTAFLAYLVGAYVCQAASARSVARVRPALAGQAAAS